MVLAVALVVTACTSALVAAPPTADTSPRPHPTPPPTTDCPPLGSAADIDPEQMEIPATPEAMQPIKDATAHLRCLPQAVAEQQVIPRSEIEPTFDRTEEPDERELQGKVDPFAKLLGWIPADTSLEEVLDTLTLDLVLGFYIPQENRLYIVNEGELLTPLAQATFAHEWVHALQQPAFDFEKLQDDLPDFDFDGSSAVAALVEGDALYFEDEFVDEFFSREKRNEKNRDEQETGSQDPTEFVDVLPLLFDMLMPYLHGPKFIEAVIGDGGSPPLTDVYARPPKTTTEILHPELYKDGFKAQQVNLPDIAGTLGPDWTASMDGTWGEYSTANFIGGLAGTFADRELTLVDGWQGDHLGFWQNGGSNVAAIATAWAEPDKASDVRHRLQGIFQSTGASRGEFYEFPGDRYYRVTSTGNETLILMTNDPAAAEALGGVASDGSLPGSSA